MKRIAGLDTRTDGDLCAWGGEVGAQDQAGVGVRVDGREVSERGAVVRRVHAGQLAESRAANTRPHRLVSMDCGTQNHICMQRRQQTLERAWLKIDAGERDGQEIVTVALTTSPSL